SGTPITFERGHTLRNRRQRIVKLLSHLRILLRVGDELRIKLRVVDCHNGGLFQRFSTGLLHRLTPQDVARDVREEEDKLLHGGKGCTSGEVERNTDNVYSAPDEPRGENLVIQKELSEDCQN